ncbi:MAG: tRNA pseudouridine synthase [Planctomycetota bacterium]|jgi:tRNA pseudouridine13 synthase
MTTEAREETGFPEGEIAATGSTNSTEFLPHPSCGLLVPSNWITNATPHERLDPRPGPRASTEPGIGGRLKDRPSDFIVEEIPSYDPSGEGEHIYLGIQKTNMPHTEMLGVICRHFNVEEFAVGFAGMKDRVAVTHQTVSVHLPVDRPVGELKHDRLVVMWAKRHTNKLRRGHLRGNRFVIRMRGIDPMQVRTVKLRLEMLAKQGIPDYFGEQRFGYRLNNHIVGRYFAHAQWQQLLDEMLGSRGAPFPPHQLEVRELYDRGEFQAAYDIWGRNDQAERIALRALGRGRDAAGAVRAIPGHTRSFWMSALQGAVYNHALSQRVRDGTFGAVLRGDVAMLGGSSSVFPIAHDAPADELAVLESRCAAHDISAAGPIPGPGMLASSGLPREIELRALAACGVEDAQFVPPALDGAGARRPYRIMMRDWSVDAGVDEHGGYIRVMFDLQKGAFATVLCREIMGKIVGDGVV